MALLINCYIFFGQITSKDVFTTFTGKTRYMIGKYIKIITFLGLIIILVLQSVWLANTYQLLEHQLYKTGNRLFPKAVLNETIERLSEISGVDTTLNLSSNMNYDENLNDQRLKEHIISFLNHYADSLYQSQTSLPLLDSIFKSSLEEEGYKAELYCIKVDSLGNSLETDNESHPNGFFRTVKTSAVSLNWERTEYVQAVIVNPYIIVFRKMSFLLIATAFLLCFVVWCIVYQVRIIIRQNKIALIRQDFTYAMIHDMKTPINTITMASHALESGLMDNKPELKKQYFSIINEESSHLLNLSEKILTIAKLEQSRLKFTSEEVDLSVLFEELVMKYNVKTDKNVTFLQDCPQPLSIATDKEYLKEVISNLIDNSLKYSNKDVTIKLSTELQSNSVVIKVWDNGWGIPLKEQKHIFDKFHRGGLEYRKDRKVAGFGLGLNYVYKVVTAMNGNVSLNSVEGKYSEFVITLPIKK